MVLDIETSSAGVGLGSAVIGLGSSYSPSRSQKMAILRKTSGGSSGSVTGSGEHDFGIP